MLPQFQLIGERMRPRACATLCLFASLFLVTLFRLTQANHYHAESNCGHNHLPHVIEPRIRGNLLYETHPYMGTKNKRLTDADKRLFRPLRIHYDTSHLEGVLTSDRKSFVELNLLKRASDRLAEVLRVIPVQGNLKLTPRCRSYWSTGDRQCAKYDLPMRCGDIVQIPTEHLGSEPECPLRPTQCTMTQGGAGIPNADVVIYVTAYQYSACASASTLAFAASCARDDVMDRPVAGYINLCPSQLDTANPNSVESVQKWEYITIHEITHVLGVSSSHFAFFRDRLGNPRTPRDAFGYPPLQSGMFAASENTVKLIDLPDGTKQNYIVTETAVQIARSHFGCPTLPGIALEDAGGLGSAGSHVEARYYYGDFMNAAIPQFPVISSISLAILQDSNWYMVDFAKANAFVWGSGKGCEFVNGACLVKRSRDPPDAPFPELFCAIPNQMGCTYDLKGKGMCSMGRYSADIAPTQNQYFADPRQGGNRMTNYCPMFSVYNQVGAGLSSCTDPSAQPESSSNPRGESYSASARCVVNTLNRSGSSISQRGGCYNVDCSKYPLEVRLSVGGQMVSCKREEQGKTKSVSGYGGSLQCPEVDRICADIVSDPCHAVICPSNSKCVNGGCECLPNWFGTFCDVTTCHDVLSNDTALACTGRGNCIEPDKCCCDAGYIGDKCETMACFSIPQDDPSVCSAHGTCDGPNQCTCGTGYYGNQCEKPMCFGVKSNDTTVCKGRGSCTAPNVCECFDGYLGTECEKFKCIDGASGSIVTCEGQSACTHVDAANTDCICQGGPGEDICENTLRLLAEGSKNKLIINLFLRGDVAGVIHCTTLFDEASLDKLGTGPKCEWTSAREITVLLGADAKLNENDILRVNMNPFHQQASYYDVNVHYKVVTDEESPGPSTGSDGSSSAVWVFLGVGGAGLGLLLCLSCILGIVVYFLITRVVRGSRKAPRREQMPQSPTPMTPAVVKEGYTTRQRRNSQPLEDGDIYVTEKRTTRWKS